MSRPSFFIVGAPKCGTTALYHALLKHPSLFLPHSDDADLYWKHKEPFHFCSDLGIAEWLRVDKEADYLQLFDAAAPAQIAGEASALNLFSQEAPERIHQFTGGEAKIIIMLRSPVTWMRSWHHDLLVYGYEDLTNFEDALAAGPERDRGRRLPRRAAFSGCLNYRRLAHFSPFIQRYRDIFGDEQVALVDLQELNADPAAVLKRLFRFLGIEEGPLPSLERENDSSTLPATHHLDLMVNRLLARLPGGRHLIANLPRKLYRASTAWLPPLSDKSIDPALRKDLEDEFAEETSLLRQLCA
ncbi:MAG: sulfotransferase [Verrucomicrobiota bacterium JB023]|nr:sulfotransferase [Verrucomicrobiota bacterium JB023]